MLKIVSATAVKSMPLLGNSHFTQNSVIYLRVSLSQPGHGFPLVRTTLQQWCHSQGGRETTLLDVACPSCGRGVSWAGTYMGRVWGTLLFKGRKCSFLLCYLSTPVQSPGSPLLCWSLMLSCVMSSSPSRHWASRAGGGQEWEGWVTPSFDQTCPSPWLHHKQRGHVEEVLGDSWPLGPREL